jgi:hypothetical protein
VTGKISTTPYACAILQQVNKRRFSVLEFPNGRYLRFNFRHQFPRAVLSPSGSRSQTAAAPVQVRLDSSRPVNYTYTRYSLSHLAVGTSISPTN